MRSRSRQVGRYEGAKLGIDRGLVGLGEPLEMVPENLNEALTLTKTKFGPKSARLLSRFAYLPEKTLVWTKTGDDEYRLGVIRGPWRYDSSDEAAKVGICQVRAADWLTERFNEATVPESVCFTYSRGGLNPQRIADPFAEQFSREQCT